MEKVINHFYGQAKEKNVMLAEMEKTKRYLKYGFDIDVVNATPCVAHSIQFGFHRVADAPLCVCCQQISFLFSLPHQKNILRRTTMGVTRVAVSDCQ